MPLWFINTIESFVVVAKFVFWHDARSVYWTKYCMKYWPYFT